MHNFKKDVAKELRGAGVLDNESLVQLTHGARIKSLFKERLPDILAQVSKKKIYKSNVKLAAFKIISSFIVVI